MELGDLVAIDSPRHPLKGFSGRIVGRRGERSPGDFWLLIYVRDRARSYLVPESMVRLIEKKSDGPAPFP
ncbi:MAG TPA: hypothetical protein PKY58_03960 [Syntrophales bacterium]|jgi:hypothetical protein|nr:hypothetical protein [Syntrophales bacterium]HQN76835.1 hypothetical protein [Syntrophales bacterium]HQQ26657.1 hypothetical protein [Syntrophales bacterium]